MRPAPVDDSALDEIKREDGLLRFWMYYNGEWAETISGLVAGISFIFWCFLYVLGYAQSTLGHVLLGIAIAGFMAWRFLFRILSDYQRCGWEKGKGRSPRLERREAYVAASLWLFIFISVGITLFLQWRHLTKVPAFFLAVFGLSVLACPVLAKKKPPAHPININTANSSDLQQVAGIGPSTAQKILAPRESCGAFKSVDDLLSIKGIGPRKLEKMRKCLTAGKPLCKKQSTAPTKPPPAKSPAKQPGTPSPTASEGEEP